MKKIISLIGKNSLVYQIGMGAIETSAHNSRGGKVHPAQIEMGRENYY